MNSSSFIFKFLTIIVLLMSNVIAIELPDDNKSTLDSDGYFRHGFGVSDKGGEQTAFGLPFAPAKYRLGNENDTNLELALDYHYYVDGVNNKKNVQFYVMMDGYATYDENFEFNNVPQLYLSFNGFIGEDINIWVGRRYYDRKAMEINDHYWLNVGQHSTGGAAGIENIPIGNAKLKFAVFQGIDTESDSIMSLFYDARVSDIKLNNFGELTLWAMYAQRYAPNNPTDSSLSTLKNQGGYGVGFWHDLKVKKKISNTFALVYKNGAAVPQHDFNYNPLINNPDIKDVNYLEINNDFVYENKPDYSIEWAMAFRKTLQTNNANKTYDIDWYSSGIRPIIYFSRHLNLATELGYDYIDNKETRQEGGLVKGTIALQLSMERGYYERPVIRFFYTAAKWDRDFQGEVGGDAYKNVTEGNSIGVQTEWWW